MTIFNIFVGVHKFTPTYSYPLLPYAAPSTGDFGGNSPLGVRHGCRTLPEGQEVPSGNPVKTEERRKQAAFGSPFLWILSFAENCSCIFRIHHVHVAWTSKEKYPACQCGNWHLINRRGSNTLLIPYRKTADLCRVQLGRLRCPRRRGRSKIGHQILHDQIALKNIRTSFPLQSL
jgi:hypothetical protein